MTSNTTTDLAISTANMGQPTPGLPTKIVADVAKSTVGDMSYPLRTVIAASGIQEVKIRFLTSSQETLTATPDTRSL